MREESYYERVWREAGFFGRMHMRGLRWLYQLQFWKDWVLDRAWWDFSGDSPVLKHLRSGRMVQEGQHEAGNRGE